MVCMRACVFYMCMFLQVLYAQFKIVKIGSLSYAKGDDGNSIKTPAADESQGCCCHVLECADEMCVYTNYHNSE